MPANEYQKVQIGAFTYQVKAVMDQERLLYHCGYVSFPAALSAVLDIKAVDWHGGTTLDKVQGKIRTIGFDCAHACDTIGEPLAENFRDYQFVERECKSCIRQLCEQLCGASLQNGDQA